MAHTKDTGVNDQSVKNSGPQKGTRSSGDGSGNEVHTAILDEDALDALARALLLLRSPDEVRKFLTDLCTHKELRDLAERLGIARLLDSGGLSYRDISAKTGASTTTVGRVARFLNNEPHQGYRLVLDRMGALNHDKPAERSE